MRRTDRLRAVDSSSASTGEARARRSVPAAPWLRRPALVPSLLRSFDDMLLQVGTPVGPTGAPPVLCAVQASSAPRGTLAWKRRLLRGLVVLDFAAAAIAGLVALLVRFGTGGPDVYLLVTLAAPVVWVLSCASVRGYEQRFLGRATRSSSGCSTQGCACWR